MRAWRNILGLIDVLKRGSWWWYEWKSAPDDTTLNDLIKDYQVKKL